MNRRRFLIAMTGLVLCACGGSGSSGGSPVTATRSVLILWPPRTREFLHGPGSALSAKFTFPYADAVGRDIVMTANRDAGKSEPYTGTYSTPRPMSLSASSLQVQFYAQANAQGTVVATASATFTTTSETLVLANIVLNRKIKTVRVAPISLRLTRQQTQLSFTAKDADGNIVAVSPGSARWSLEAGSDTLDLTNDGLATPRSSGTARVQAGIDYVYSNLATVTVEPAFARVLRFSGPNNTIQLTGLRYGGTAPLNDRFTVEAILKPTSGGLVWQQWTNSAMNELMRIRNGKFEVAASGGGEPLIVITGDTVPLNTWSHIAWVYDGRETRLYRNGALVLRKAGKVNTPFATADAAAIGRNSATVGLVDGDQPFSGDLAEFRISSAVRYVGDTYTVPTKPWDDDRFTQMLVDPSEVVGSPASFSLPGTEAMTGTLGGGGNGATSPTWESYVP